MKIKIISDLSEETLEQKVNSFLEQNKEKDMNILFGIGKSSKSVCVVMKEQKKPKVVKDKTKPESANKAPQTGKRKSRSAKSVK